MNSILLFETFKSQRELEKLANDILLGIAKHTYNTTKPLWDHNENDDQLKSVFYNILSIQKIIDHINIEEYDELKEFLQEFNIEINLIKINIGGLENVKGRYNTEYNYKDFKLGGKITIKYDNDIITEITKQRNEYLKNGTDFTYKDIYFKLFFEMYKILLHELQHAYDDYRTKGEYIKDKDSSLFYDDQKNIDNLKRRYFGNEKLTEEEIKRLVNNSKKYLRLRHEIDARFTQTIQQLRFYTAEFKDVEQNKDNEKDMIIIYSMKRFEKVLYDFKILFDGWKVLSPTMQKRLLQKLGKFYELAKGEKDERNHEERIRVFGKGE